MSLSLRSYENFLYTDNSLFLTTPGPLHERILMYSMILSLSGCSHSGGSAVLGALGGAATDGGGYDHNLKKQKGQVEADFKDGKID